MSNPGGNRVSFPIERLVLTEVTELIPDRFEFVFTTPENVERLWTVYQTTAVLAKGWHWRVVRINRHQKHLRHGRICQIKGRMAEQLIALAMLLPRVPFEAKGETT